MEYVRYFVALYVSVVFIAGHWTYVQVPRRTGRLVRSVLTLLVILWPATLLLNLFWPIIYSFRFELVYFGACDMGKINIRKLIGILRTHRKAGKQKHVVMFLREGN